MMFFPPAINADDLLLYADVMTLNSDTNTLTIHTSHLARHLGLPDDLLGRLHAAMPFADLARRRGWRVDLLELDDVILTS